MASHSQPRPLMAMCDVSESRQPYSMMHRALYANIVGEEALSTFAHGCTVKQYDGRDYIVDHVTRLARPVSSFPTFPVVSQAEFEAQHAHLYALKDRLDVLRPQVRELEGAVKDAHRRENRLEGQARTGTSKAKVPGKTPPSNPSRHVSKVVPSSETHLVSLIAQVLRIGEHNKAKNLSSAQIKVLRSAAPALSTYYFRWKQGTIVWGRPLSAPQSSSTKAL